MTLPPLGQSDTPLTFEINDPTTKDVPQTEPSHSRGGTYNLRPNPNPNYSEIYRYWRVQNFIQPLIVRYVRSSLSSFSFFRTHQSKFFLFSGAHLHIFIQIINDIN